MKKFKNLIIILAALLISSCSGSQEKSASKEDPQKINLKLEIIEDQVRLAIQNGDQAKALELANQLVHPLHEKWEGKATKEIFGLSVDDYYYDDYWTEKRNKYKDQIMAMSDKVESTTNGALNEATNIQSGQDAERIAKSMDFTGEWKGEFGDNQIILAIVKIDNGQVSGYNIIQGKTRRLKGTVDANNNFELSEPGDDEWDGVFKFTIEAKQAKGSWVSNNGKLTIDFKLTK